VGVIFVRFATEQVGLEGDLGAYTVACLNLLPRTNWASGPRSMGLCRLLSEPSLETVRGFIASASH
jgi:hypothetical protein